MRHEPHGRSLSEKALGGSARKASQERDNQAHRDQRVQAGKGKPEPKIAHGGFGSEVYQSAVQRTSPRFCLNRSRWSGGIVPRNCAILDAQEQTSKKSSRSVHRRTDR